MSMIDRGNSLFKEITMLCYKDMTFCPFLDCKVESCHRRLTEKIKKDAENFGLPVARFIDRPDCYEGKENQI